METIIEDELERMLMAAPSAGVDARPGQSPWLTRAHADDKLGPTTMAMPRARLQ